MSFKKVVTGTFDEVQRGLFSLAADLHNEELEQLIKSHTPQSSKLPANEAEATKRRDDAAALITPDEANALNQHHIFIHNVVRTAEDFTSKSKWRGKDREFEFSADLSGTANKDGTGSAELVYSHDGKVVERFKVSVSPT
jgi:hypothetical protein